MLTEKQLKNFWDKVEKTDDCWLWTAANNGHGYGLFWFDRKMSKAHRISWVIHNGNIPNGLFVCHSCDVRNCVNPDHLFLGTNADNMLDMAEKGRNNQPKGVAQAHAIFTDDQIIEIRNTKGKTQRQLARQFNTTQSNISAIILRKTWNHIEA